MEFGIQHFLFSNSLGKWGFGLSGGIGMTSGNGRFEKNLQEAKEKYKLYILPVRLGAVYRLQTKPPTKRWVTPYASTGLYYLGLWEIRDSDDKQTRTGLLGFYFTGGVLFSLHSLLPQKKGMNSSQVQNLWVQASLQQVQAGNAELKVSDTLFTLGVMMDLFW